MSEQIVHEVRAEELNSMLKQKRIGAVRKMEGKQAKFTCSSCNKEKISAVHFSLNPDWLVSKLFCSRCFNAQTIAVRKKGFFSFIRK